MWLTLAKRRIEAATIVNKYSGNCDWCGKWVPANSGAYDLNLRKSYCPSCNSKRPGGTISTPKPRTPMGITPSRPTASPAEMEMIKRRAAATGAKPYQVEDAVWLAGKDRALLAHQQGLGKTAIALLALSRSRGAIVICPVNVVENWADEAQRWAPEFTPVIIRSKDDFKFPQQGEIVIVGYDRIPDEFKSGKKKVIPKNGKPFKYFHGSMIAEDLKQKLSQCSVIVDEAHFVKKQNTIRGLKVMSMCANATSSWMLTGTPIANRPIDLKGILKVGDMFESTFKNAATFDELMRPVYEEITVPGKKKDPNAPKSDDDEEDEEENTGPRKIKTIVDWLPPLPQAHRLLEQVMNRRLKKDTLDLPEKTYTDEKVELNDANLEKEMDDALADWEHSSGVDENGMPTDLPPFEQFAKMRADVARYKIPAALQIVQQFEQRGEPLLVFSSHRQPVETIGNRPGWAIIEGGILPKKRRQIVKAFQNGELKGIALTIIAGGVGITLTHAATALFVDLDWNPGNNEQAEDRIHRIGQESESVNVIRLVVDHPMDAHVNSLLAKKQKWIRDAIEFKVERLMGEDDKEVTLNGQRRKISSLTESELQQVAMEELSKESEHLSPEELAKLQPEVPKAEVERPRPTERPAAQMPQPVARPAMSGTIAPQKKNGILEAINHILSSGVADADLQGFLNGLMARRIANENLIDLMTDGDYTAVKRMLMKYFRSSGGSPALLGREGASRI